jgi:hypothetical protein
VTVGSEVKGGGDAAERRCGSSREGRAADEADPVFSQRGGLTWSQGLRASGVAGWILRVMARARVLGPGRVEVPRSGEISREQEIQESIGRRFGATRVGVNGLAGGARLRSR